MLHEVAARQGLDLLLVERGLVAKVEGVQPLDEGEAGEVGAHGDVLGGLRGNLLGEDLVQEVGVGELLGRGLLQHRLEPLPALEEPQPLQMLVQSLELGGLHDAISGSIRDSVRSARAGDRSAPPGAREARGVAI